ncbi:hypothetical protein AL492_17695 [Elizabethkingia anophelis]|uniref:CotH kinase family protein n=1 Tax=Elizabethkingia anophelis TaxID=1117645 RepID=UPI000CE99F4A|nr:CotH kinase family protein [Elizabethkingia anophelis]AVF49357.1 hypothetical protein AL491_15290 [Elizabethkingia anophelis]AVF53352.1 hypothetical protein AL492_17695 [Elizabethkingia anophelis]
MKRPRNTLKTYFQKGKKPTEEQFSDTLDSYVHKDDSVPIDNVEGLRGSLDSKLDRGAESELIKVFDDKLEEAKNTINKAYLGIAKPASTVPAIGSFWFRVKEGNVTTFPNFKDSAGNPISTIPEDFEKAGALFDVTIEITDGVAEKDLRQKVSGATPQWSNKPFNKGSQVFYDGAIWEANAITTGDDVPGISNRWDLKLKALQKSNGDNIFNIVDASGKLLATWDVSGFLWTSYATDSIPATAIEGLVHMMRGLTSANTSDLFQLRDLSGNIIGSIDREGTLRIKNIITDSIDVVNSPIKSPVTSLTNVVIPEQHYLRINFIGTLPWDATPTRTPVPGVLEFYDRFDNLLIRLNTKLSIQGQSSAGDQKKGYSADFLNDKGEDVFIKFGDFPAVKGMHMKAFLRDGAHVRDTGGGTLWQQFIKSRPYPSNQFKIPYPDLGGQPPYNQYAFYADAKYSLQGIPFGFYVGGKFYGLYTLRQKKGVENFAMNNKNQKHIFLDSTAENGVPVGLGNQNYADFTAMNVAYELRSPKSPDATAKANCMRLFTYFKGVYAGTTDLKTTYSPYLDPIDWIDWLIIAEVLAHWDSVGNNASYFSYDGLKWKPGLFDLEFTAGNYGDRNPAGMYIIADVWPKFRTAFATEIKARYTDLRRNGVLNINNIVNIYGGIAKYIPMDIWNANGAEWGALSAATNPWGYQLGLDGIYSWFSQRINWLDTVWLNP